MILDNLSIGGFQRLALDQAYEFSENNYQVSILVLSNPIVDTEPSFVKIEESLIERFKIQINFLGTSRFKQFFQLKHISSTLRNGDILLSHSLRGTALLVFRKFQLASHPKLITTIHQLPTLSAPRQRFQRYCYAQMTDILIGYSEAVRQDWQLRIKEYPVVFQRALRKNLHVIRNGIYSKRLPELNLNDFYTPRLLFLGRNTSWKGVDTFFRIASHPLLSNFEILMLVPKEEDVSLQELGERLTSRLTVISGKSVAYLKSRPGDVHIYPASYGKEAKHIESVSLNCLELASIGVPTILTKNGTHTWPDLNDFGIFFETDWSDMDEVARIVQKASLMRVESLDVEKIRELISIRNNINELIRIAQPKSTLLDENS